MSILYTKAKLKFSNNMNRGLGMLPDEPDERDLQFGIFGLFDYKPKYESHIIPTLSVKDQYRRNDCTAQSIVAGKEIDEGMELSVRSQVLFMKKQGFISSDGFSTLRKSQKSMKKYGVAEEKVLETIFRNWRQYSNLGLLTKKVYENASHHKTKSYWKVNSMDDVYKNLDEYRTVQTALDWYSGYQGHGLNEKALVDYKKGYYLGGHADLTIGYIRDYHGQDVVVRQNSFSKLWGDLGLYYMRVEDYKKELAKFGGFVNLDMPADIGKFLNAYTGHYVIGKGPQIYYIQNGKKHNIANEEVWDDLGNPIPVKVSESHLKKIPEGKVIYSKQDIYD